MGAACVDWPRRQARRVRAAPGRGAGWAGRADDGLAVADQALAATSPDATGWSLPADPLFAPLRAAAGYGRLAARLGSRAS